MPQLDAPTRRKLMRLIKLGAVLVYLISKIPISGDPPSSASVLLDDENYASTSPKRLVKGTGFHLVLESEFTGTGTAGDATCDLGLVERLPNQVYVDPYQVHELVRIHAVNNRQYGIGYELEITLDPATVNLESNASNKEQSKNQTVYIKTTTTTSTSGSPPTPHVVVLQLPIHLRYHAASASKRQEEVVLPPPVICAQAAQCWVGLEKKKEAAFACEEHFGAEFEEYVVVMKQQQQQTAAPTQETLFEPAAPTATRRLQAFDDPITVLVPVGDANQVSWVFAITLFSVVLGTLAIVRAVMVM